MDGRSPRVGTPIINMNFVDFVESSSLDFYNHQYRREA